MTACVGSPKISTAGVKISTSTLAMLATFCITVHILEWSPKGNVVLDFIIADLVSIVYCTKMVGVQRVCKGNDYFSVTLH